MAGSMVLLGLVLGTWVHPVCHFLSAYVGANLLQSAFTRFWPLEIALEMAGVGDPAGR